VAALNVARISFSMKRAPFRVTVKDA